MHRLLSIVAAVVITATTATATAQASRLTPGSGGEDALIAPWGWLGLPIEVFTEDDGDCVVSIYYVPTGTSGVYPLWAEVVCAELAPDEEEDW